MSEYIQYAPPWLQDAYAWLAQSPVFIQVAAGIALILVGGYLLAVISTLIITLLFDH